MRRFSPWRTVADRGDVVDLAFANGVVVEHLTNGDVVDVEVRSGSARGRAQNHPGRNG